MTGNTGRTLRQFGHVSVLVGMVLGATAQTIPASEAAGTCFGQAATVADHSGTIQGTSGDDTITGDNGANPIDAKSGVDRIRGLGGDDWLYGWMKWSLRACCKTPYPSPCAVRARLGMVTGMLRPRRKPAPMCHPPRPQGPDDCSGVSGEVG